MKKIVIVMFITLLLVSCKRQSSKNKNVLYIADVEIKIPLPDEKYVDVDIEKNDFLRNKIIDSHYLLGVFVDGYDFRKFKNNKLDSNLLFNIISVGYEKTFLSKDILQDDFIVYFLYMKNDLKKLLKDKYLALEMPEIKKKCKFTKDEKKEFETINRIYNERNAYSIICSSYLIEKGQFYKIYFTRSYIWVKKKMICINIMCENKGEESNKWINEITVKYIKNMLEANKN